MPWVRIDENAMDHPKFLALSDGAWRLWCEGQAYCQKHLTDGLVLVSALRGFRYHSVARVANLTAELVPGKGPLWHRESDGNYRVHDFLEWNESRAEVLKARAEAKERRDRWKRKRDASLDASSDADGTTNVVRGVVCSGSPPKSHKPVGEGGTGETVTTDSRSKRPVFKGQRFVVFDWMLADLSRMLGSHAEAFDFHAWFYDLDAQAVAADVVVPQRDGGKWLQERTHEEALRRGLPIAVQTHNPKTAGNVAAAARFIARGQR